MNYPFGEALKKVQQLDRTPKEYFILGVYASAVHAKWKGPDNKVIVRALAVACEPYIFWRGENAEEIISKIKIPAEIGKLEAAGAQFNGPSGLTLDEKYLKPLGLSRDDVWLCDLLPYTRLNTGQAKAIIREYKQLAELNNLPEVSIPRVPKSFCDEERAQEIVKELEESKAKKIILLGDTPIKEFLTRFDDRFKRLSDFNIYGKWHKFKIREKEYQVLPLVHPRQAGKLGKSSYDWFKKHQNWISSIEQKQTF